MTRRSAFIYPVGPVPCCERILSLRVPAASRCAAVLILIPVLLAGCRGETPATSAEGIAATGQPGQSLPESTFVDRYPEQPALAWDPLQRDESGSDPSGKFVFLDPSDTGVDFVNAWEQTEENFNCLDSYLIANGVALGDYDRDGLPDIYLARQEDGGRLYRNLGGMKFEDVTTQAGLDPAGISSVGGTFVDLTGDGHLDLYICAYGSPNRLYVNDGQGRFTEQASRYGLDYNGASVSAACGDYDGDGDVDLYLVTNRLYTPRLPRLAGSPTTEGPNGETMLNPEFRERYYLQSYPDGTVRPERGGEFDHLYRNDGDRFVDVSKESRIGEFAYLGLSANWWDFDEDGRLDLYVANDFKGPDLLYRNNGPNSDGDVTFSDVLPLAMPHTPWFSMGSDFADINHDGRVDYFATDMSATNHYRDKLSMGAMSGPTSDAWFLNWPTPPQYVRNCLYLNTGEMRFMEVAALAGLASSDWTWTAKFDDFDNDGHDDVYFTNGMSIDSTNGDLRAEVGELNLPDRQQGEFWWSQPRYELQNMAFRNKGGLKFESVGHDWGLNHMGVSTGAATADLDADGDLDLVVNGFREPVRIYRNDLDSGNSVRFRFRGSASNRDGLGVRLELATGSRQPVQTKWLASGRGFASSSEPVLHFGTGEETEIQLVRVRWPSGVVQTFENLPANRLYTITEKETAGQPVSITASATDLGGSQPAMFETSPGFRNIRHVERDWDDFEREPLLPNRHSQLGPGIAWGDVDGDGDEDFWMGQAAGTPGQLLTNQGDGSFRNTRQQVFAEDAACEDMGAALIDVDRDGDLDLYVASGSVECEPGDDVLADRLYLNDGRGKFSRAASGSLPGLRNSGGVVAPMDFDRDGDLDLFVGSRIVPGAYPTAPESALLVNQEGRFENGIDQVAPELKLAGMVTSAVWVDVNDDGWQDLMVSYDWGSPRLFVNRQGRLEDVSEAAGLTGHLGWFTSISPGDIDNDGDPDFVVGNFGLNTKYKATTDKPELMFYGDFENNGKNQIVEAKYENGVCLPRRGLGCTSGAMPTIKEKLPTYHEFAISSLTDIYTPAGLDSADRYEVNWLESCLLVNTGVEDGVPRFEFRKLPRIAQASPVFGSTLTDVDGDGNLDLYLVQNFHGPQRETGNMDGGVSLLMKGDGAGNFQPVWPDRSGLLVGGDAKALAVTDLDQDQRPDFVVSINNGRPLGFLNRNPVEYVRIVAEPEGHRSALGSRLVIRAPDGSPRTLDCVGGGSYLSQSTARWWVPADFNLQEMKIRWPDGSLETFANPPAESGLIILREGQGTTAK